MTLTPEQIATLTTATVANLDPADPAKAISAALLTAQALMTHAATDGQRYRTLRMAALHPRYDVIMRRVRPRNGQPPKTDKEFDQMVDMMAEVIKSM